MVTPEQKLSLVGARQHGLVTGADVAAAGMSRGRLRHRVDTGEWVRVERGVYRVGAAPTTWESRLLMRVLAAGEGAVASHRAAARLWDLDIRGIPLPELTVPRDRRYRRDGIHVHESLDLHLANARQRGGIPVTGLRRTILDLGAVIPRAQVLDVIDVARRTYRLSWDELTHTVALHSVQGRNGIGPLRAILDDHYRERSITESRFERLVERLLAAHGVQPPHAQFDVRIGGRAARIDLAWPDRKVALELDGATHRTDHAFHADRARQNELELLGWTVLRYTWKQYLNEPQRIVADVKRALAVRARVAS